MEKKNNKQKLGRGLDSLLGGNRLTGLAAPEGAAGSTEFANLAIEEVHPNPNQPRTDFDEEALNELAESIRENGVITPITVRRMGEGNYQIVAGERRFRAAQMAGLERIPAYIREVDDDELLRVALVENIQREDLNAIEIALSYNSLAQGFGLTQEQIAEQVGKRRSTVANYMRLLTLPAEIQLGLKEGKIDMGHARALASVESAERQLEVYEKVVKGELSVRKTDELCKKKAKGDDACSVSTGKSMTEVADLEDGLGMILGSKVKVVYNDKGNGKITISFRNDNELERLMSLFELLKE